jgi:DNA polymerase III sliding clamp (beta) subunit (PCNA family)
MEARIRKVGSLKKVVDSLKDFTNEVSFHCVKHGIFVVSLDSSHVSCVSLGLYAGFFESYEATENLNLGINLTRLVSCHQYYYNNVW